MVPVWRENAARTEQRGHIMAPPCPTDPCLCPPQAWPAHLTPSVSSMARRAHGVSICVSIALSLALLGAGALVLSQAFCSTLPSTPAAAGIKVKCMGSPGHGSRFISNTAAEKMVREGVHPVHPPCCPGLPGPCPWGWSSPAALPSPAQSHQLLPGLQGEREAEVGDGQRDGSGLVESMKGVLGIPSQAVIWRCCPVPQFPILGDGRVGKHLSPQGRIVTLPCIPQGSSPTQA